MQFYEIERAGLVVQCIINILYVHYPCRSPPLSLLLSLCCYLLGFNLSLLRLSFPLPSFFPFIRVHLFTLRPSRSVSYLVFHSSPLIATQLLFPLVVLLKGIMFTHHIYIMYLLRERVIELHFVLTIIMLPRLFNEIH